MTTRRDDSWLFFKDERTEGAQECQLRFFLPPVSAVKCVHPVCIFAGALLRICASISPTSLSFILCLDLISRVVLWFDGPSMNRQLACTHDLHCEQAHSSFTSQHPVSRRKQRSHSLANGEGHETFLLPIDCSISPVYCAFMPIGRVAY